VVKFVFVSEFAIETFFKGCFSRLKKIAVKSTVGRNIYRIMKFENANMTSINENKHGPSTISTYVQYISYAECLSLSIWILCYSNSSCENVSISDDSFYYRMIY
jgi:hypothetical protein